METPEKCFLLILCAFGILNFTNAQTTVRVSSVIDVPYLMKNVDGEFTGIIPDVLDSLNINYTITLSPDFNYGSRANGSWSGMVGELVNGNADMAGLLTVTALRSEDVDFSYPVIPVEHSILMKKLNTMKSSFTDNLARLFIPFEPTVWLMALVALFVTGTVLYIMMHFNPYEWRRMSRDHEATMREGESFTCLNSFFFITSTLLWQGYVRAPRSIGARFLVVAWWMFTVIFLISYTANLTNFLRISPDYNRSLKFFNIQNLEDLSKSDDIRVGFLTSGATNRFFRESNSPVYKNLYHRATNDPEYDEFLSISRLVMFVRTNEDGKFAAIVESPTARYLVNRKPCDLFDISANGFMYMHMAFAFPKNSNLTRDVNMALIKLTETGKLKEIVEKWFDEQAECSDTFRPTRLEPDDVFYSLNLSTFSSALLIVVAGIVIGGLICVIEVCIYKWAESRDSSDETEHIKADEEPLKAAEGTGPATPV